MRSPTTISPLPDEEGTSSSVSKICVVCGDKSYGLNFNAITCESCKAFFRRNALSKKELACPFNNACTVTRVTRRFCQKCRLVKCFAVGMNKEHIMSEEDKEKKRKKIESNRAKKKQNNSIPPGEGEPPVKVKKEEVDNTESIDPDDLPLAVLNNPFKSHSIEVATDTKPIPVGLGNEMSLNQIPPTTTATPSTSSVSSARSVEESFVWPTLDSSPSEMVNSIIDSPVGSGRVISHLMQTAEDALLAMGKILNSPKDAIKFISHFINTPGDALKIISKIMNSPFDALTIFTKFMSSPTDALEVITKVIQSPDDVLQFLQQLMRSPEDGLEIMNKFMNAPAEALRMINNMMNHTNHLVDSTTKDGEGAEGRSPEGRNNNLIDIEPSDSIMNNSAQLKVILDRMGEHLSSSPTSTMPSSSTVDGEEEATKGSINLNENETLTMTNRETIEEGVGLNVNQEKQNQQIPPFPLQALFGGLAGSSTGQTTTQDIIDMLINQSVNSMDSVILSEAIKLEYECAIPITSGGMLPNQSPSMYLSPNPNSSGGGLMNDVRALNDVEQAKLQELILAHQALYAPVNEDISSLISDDYRLKSEQQGTADPQLVTLINLTAVAIRRLIKMSKKISAFKNMCQEDQVALLKGGCTEMMLLRSALQYDSEASGWKILHSHSKEATTSNSNLRADILKLAGGPVYEEHERFILTFEPKWRQDENIILIMCAIILFTHDRPKTIHSDVIKLEQNSYYYLLRRYLESVYPGCEAKSTFMRLIQKVHELRKFNEAVISVYLDVNPAEVEPLLREIFDLKNQ